MSDNLLWHKIQGIQNLLLISIGTRPEYVHRHRCTQNIYIQKIEVNETFFIVSKGILDVTKETILVIVTLSLEIEERILLKHSREQQGKYNVLGLRVLDLDLEDNGKLCKSGSVSIPQCPGRTMINHKGGQRNNVQSRPNLSPYDSFPFVCFPQG